MDEQIRNLVKILQDQGYSQRQALSAALAVEHALVCPEFAKEYGTFMVDALRDFLVGATVKAS